MKRQIFRFAGHYVEMVAAMFVGMGLLALPWKLIGLDLSDNPVLETLVIAANMTIGMAAWMAIRGHARRMIVEMSVAMVAPFMVLLAPLAVGTITADALMTAVHVLMLLTMLAVMLLRRRVYEHHHGTVPPRIRRTDLPEKVAAP